MVEDIKLTRDRPVRQFGGARFCQAALNHQALLPTAKRVSAHESHLRFYAKQAAIDCGAKVSGYPNTRVYWKSLWSM